MNSKTDPPQEKVDVQKRRGLMAAIGGLSLVWIGALLHPIYRYLSPPVANEGAGTTGKIKADKVTPADVAEPGQGKNGGYAGRGLIVLRDAEGQLRAFDAKCTHAGCNVAFEGSRLACPCHGGVYDLSGKNVSGPPPKPLTELLVFEEDGALYVSRAEKAARS